MFRLNTEHGKDPLPTVYQRSLLRRLATRFLEKLGDRRTFQRWFRLTAELFTFIEDDVARGRSHMSHPSMTQSCWMVASVPAMTLLSSTPASCTVLLRQGA